MPSLQRATAESVLTLSLESGSCECGMESHTIVYSGQATVEWIRVTHASTILTEDDGVVLLLYYTLCAQTGNKFTL